VSGRSPNWRIMAGLDRWHQGLVVSFISLYPPFFFVSRSTASAGVCVGDQVFKLFRYNPVFGVALIHTPALHLLLSSDQKILESCIQRTAIGTRNTIGGISDSFHTMTDSSRPILYHWSVRDAITPSIHNIPAFPAPLHLASRVRVIKQ
jgi:hypothetical protein